MGFKKYKGYPEYKNSGVEWIADMPKKWAINKIAHTTYVKGRIGWQNLRSDEFSNAGYLCITGTDFKNGLVNYTNAYRVSEERYKQDHNIQLKENDLLITKDGTIGKLALVKDLKEKATLNSGIFVTRPRKSTYLQEFLYYVLQSDIFYKFIIFQCSGTTISHLYQNVFEKFRYPAPPLTEQHQTASFLDHKTSKLDQLIQEKQELIELLKKKKTALITKCVTKGLDDTVPMKDSGVEWIGQIPEHWEISYIKRVSTRIQTGTTPPTQNEYLYENGTIPWFGPGCFNDCLTLKNPKKYIAEIALTEGGARLFPPDSILIVTIGATIGKTGFLDHYGSTNQQITAIIPNHKMTCPKYLAYQAKNLEDFFQKISPNTTLPILDQQDIGRVQIVVPDLSEQHQIADYLDRQTAKIDQAIQEIQESIDLLQRYKTSLITHAVTGKIDVRDWDAEDIQSQEAAYG